MGGVIPLASEMSALFLRFPLYVGLPLKTHMFLLQIGMSQDVRTPPCFHTCLIMEIVTWCLNPHFRTEGPSPSAISSFWKSLVVFPKTMLRSRGATYIQRSKCSTFSLQWEMVLKGHPSFRALPGVAGGVGWGRLLL